VQAVRRWRRRTGRMRWRPRACRECKVMRREERASSGAMQPLLRSAERGSVALLLREGGLLQAWRALCRAQCARMLAHVFSRVPTRAEICAICGRVQCAVREARAVRCAIELHSLSWQNHNVAGKYYCMASIKVGSLHASGAMG